MLSQLTTAIVEGTVHVGIVVKSAHLNLVAVNNNPRDRAVIRAIKSEGLGATGLSNNMPNNPAMNDSHHFLVGVRLVNAL